MVHLYQIILTYIILCAFDSLVLRNIKKKILYKKAVISSQKQKKLLVVLGSPKLGLSDGGIVSYITEKTIGTVYGCGDICIDLLGCSSCRKSYSGDILDFLKGKDDNSCVLFSTGVLEFTENYSEIEKQINRTCVSNFTDYYSPWNLTWFSYGCVNSKCGLLEALPNRVFWKNPLANLFF
jgi:hypothetical protein